MGLGLRHIRPSGQTFVSRHFLFVFPSSDRSSHINLLFCGQARVIYTYSVSPQCTATQCLDFQTEIVAEIEGKSTVVSGFLDVSQDEKLSIRLLAEVLSWLYYRNKTVVMKLMSQLVVT